MTELDKATRNLDRMATIANDAAKAAVKSAEKLLKEVKNAKC